MTEPDLEKLALSLMNFEDFDFSYRLLTLLAHCKPPLVQSMMRQLPNPQWIQLDPPDLQNLLVRVDDDNLARFLTLAGDKIKERILNNVSARRLEQRLNQYMAKYEIDFADYGPAKRKLTYFLAYLFLYEKISPFLQKMG